MAIIGTKFFSKYCTQLNVLGLCILSRIAVVFLLISLKRYLGIFIYIYSNVVYKSNFIYNSYAFLPLLYSTSEVTDDCITYSAFTKNNVMIAFNKYLASISNPYGLNFDKTCFSGKKRYPSLSIFEKNNWNLNHCKWISFMHKNF